MKLRLRHRAQLEEPKPKNADRSLRENAESIEDKIMDPRMDPSRYTPRG